MILQNFIFNISDFFDMFIVGKLSTEIVNGFFIGRKIIAIDFTIICGICYGTSIYFAQLIHKRTKVLKNVLMYSIIYIFLQNILFMSVFLFFARRILYLFSQNELVVSIAKEYVFFMFIILIPNSFSILIGQFLQCNGFINQSLFINGIGTFLNILLNYFLLYGISVFPELGYKGVICSTLITRIITFLSLLIFYIYKVDRKNNNLKKDEKSITINNYLKTVLPIVFQNGFWFILSAVYAALYGKTGDVNLVVFSISSTIAGLYEILINSNTNASSIILGNMIGEKKDFQEIRKYSVNLINITVLIAILIITVVIVFRGCIVSYYAISSEAKLLLKKLLIINCIYILPKSINVLIGAGILRAGGDTLFSTILDFISSVLFVLPVLSYLVFKTDFNICTIILIIDSVEILKVVCFIIRYKSYKWIKKVI